MDIRREQSLFKAVSPCDNKSQGAFHTTDLSRNITFLYSIAEGILAFKRKYSPPDMGNSRDNVSVASCPPPPYSTIGSHSTPAAWARAAEEGRLTGQEAVSSKQDDRTLLPNHSGLRQALLDLFGVNG